MEGIRSPRNSAVLVPWINSELVLFAGYSIIRQSTSRYRATIGSYLLRIEKKSVIFSGSKQIPQRNTMLSQESMEIFTRTPNFVVHFARVLWVCPPRLYSRTCQYPTQKGKFLKSIEKVAQRCSVKKAFLEIS